MGSTTVAYSPLGAQIDVATELADGIVTEAKIGAGAVTNAKVDAAADIAGSKLADNSVTVSKLSGFVNLEYVGSDLTEGTVHTSTAETTIASVTISADTIGTGALYIASVRGNAADAASNTPTFRLKSGVAASEAERESFTLAMTQTLGVGGCFAWYDTAPTWSGDVNVIITGQNNHSDANSQATVLSLVVFGH